jgi:hypothetical protein
MAVRPSGPVAEELLALQNLLAMSGALVKVVLFTLHFSEKHCSIWFFLRFVVATVMASGSIASIPLFHYRFSLVSG